MGRTVPSFRYVIEDQYKELAKFGRGLRREDRELFEEMMLHARRHTQAGSYATLLDPFQSIVLGMLIEQEKKMRRLHAGNPH